jgi:glutaminase
MTKALIEMSVEELEQESYKLTEQRRLVRVKALAVQNMLSKRVEEQRISKMLGREVQVVDVESIDSDEAVGEPK